jgi:DUF4097 and DUF4098 domain-containing protein YvlB
MANARHCAQPRIPMIQRSFLLTSLLLASALTALATSEEILQRHFDAAPGGKLVIDVDFGSVEVTGGTAGNVVAVNARRSIDIPDRGLEKEFVAASPITITQENNVITVRSRSNRQWQWNNTHTRMDAHYAVQVPKTFNADLHTGGGSITAIDLAGEVHANTAGGKLKFSRVQGPTNAETSGGSVRLTDCDGAINVRTSGGRIDADGGRGSLHAETAGGQMSVRKFDGRIDIASNGGQLRLEEIAGPVNAKTLGGAINASISTANDVKLETNAGAITVAVPANVGFNVDAQSAVGDVSTEFPVNAQRKDREMLLGQINGGGKALFLRTSAGSIYTKQSGGARASR